VAEDLHPVFLELLLAVLDGDDAEAHALIDSVDPVALCHYTARHLCMFVGDEDRAGWHQEIRRELAGELVRHPSWYPSTGSV
jgi:hypothetical protein